MRKLIVLALALVCLCSCETAKKHGPLYYWGDYVNGVTQYEQAVYLNFKKQTSESICKLVFVYEDMVSKPGGERKMPPPGICAEYGYLLLQPETADAVARHATDKQKKVFATSDYATFFPQYAKELIAKEVEYYPESASFLKPIIRKFAGK